MGGTDLPDGQESAAQLAAAAAQAAAVARVYENNLDLAPEWRWPQGMERYERRSSPPPTASLAEMAELTAQVKAQTAEIKRAQRPESTTAQNPGGLLVKYRGGFKNRPTKGLLSYDAYRVCADSDALRIWFGTQNLVGNYKWSIVRAEPWARLTALNFASSQTTRANVPALAVFGTLGLAARREPGTLIAVSYSDGDVFFTSSAATEQLRIEFTRFVTTVPTARSKVFVNGSLLPAPAAPQQPQVVSGQDVVSQIKALGELHATGILTDAEFSAKKAELLSRV